MMTAKDKKLIALHYFLEYCNTKSKDLPEMFRRNSFYQIAEESGHKNANFVDDIIVKLNQIYDLDSILCMVDPCNKFEEE